MSKDTPQAVLFCCDYNAVRSPMAEGILKQHVGQSIGIELSKHRVRSMDEMVDWGDDLESYDLIVALSPASQRRALEFTRFAALEVEYWPIIDPTGLGESREAKLEAYRQARDQIRARIRARFPQQG